MGSSARPNGCDAATLWVGRFFPMGVTRGGKDLFPSAARFGSIARIGSYMKLPSSISLRRIVRVFVVLILVGIAAVAGCSWWMIARAKGRITRDTNNVAAHETVIVLGTSPGTAAAPNVFFTNRIATTTALWKAGKVKRIIVSGDNRRKDYNEPSAMRAALVAGGVPRDAIVLDHAGLRTLDTMFRAARVFQVGKALVVTDDWHLPRALFLADQAGIVATGVASKDVPWRRSPGTRVREVLSRVKSVLDIYVLGTKPRFEE